MTVQGGIEASQNTVMQIVGNKDGDGERTKGPGNSIYTYNMVENGEPLAEINQGAASTFRSGMYNVTKLESDTILYRLGKVGGGNQIFVSEPRKINGIEVISSSPIK